MTWLRCISWCRQFNRFSSSLEALTSEPAFRLIYRANAEPDWYSQVSLVYNDDFLSSPCEVRAVYQCSIVAVPFGDQNLRGHYYLSWFQVYSAVWLPCFCSSAALSSRAGWNEVRFSLIGRSHQLLMTVLIVCLRASGKGARWLEESILSSDIRAEILASDIWELAFYSSSGVFVNSDLFAQPASYSHV
jgi:hypothetical protein